VPRFDDDDVFRQRGAVAQFFENRPTGTVGLRRHAGQRDASRMRQRREEISRWTEPWGRFLATSADGVERPNAAVTVQHHRIQFEERKLFLLGQRGKRPERLHKGSEFGATGERLRAAQGAEPDATEKMPLQLRQRLAERHQRERPAQRRHVRREFLGRQPATADERHPARLVAGQRNEALRGQPVGPRARDAFAHQRAEPAMAGRLDAGAHLGRRRGERRGVERRQAHRAKFRLVPDFLAEPLQHNRLAAGERRLVVKPAVTRHHPAGAAEQRVGLGFADEARLHACAGSAATARWPAAKASSLSDSTAGLSLSN